MGVGGVIWGTFTVPQIAVQKVAGVMEDIASPMGSNSVLPKDTTTMSGQLP